MITENINLRELIIIVLKRWRMLIVFALMAAILFGGYQAVSGLYKIFDTKDLAHQQSVYNEDLQQYEQNKDNIKKAIVKLTKLTDEITEGIPDLNLYSDQTSAYLENMMAINDSLLDYQDQLENLSPPENLVVSPITIVKSVIKFGVVGFAGGMVLAIFIILLLDSIDNRIRDEFKLVGKYPIRLIGSLPIKVKRRIRSIDKFILRLEGKTPVSVDRKASLIMSIECLVTQIDPNIKQTIICMGSCSSVDIAEATEELSIELGAKGYLQTTLIPSGNILSSAETVAALSTSDAILLCERINSSTFTAVEQEIQYLKAFEKPILGILFV